MRCSKCGNEIADNAKFCGKCGNKVLAEAQEFSYKEPAVSENKNSGKLVMKPKTKKIIGIVALLMIVGVSAVLFGRFYRKNVAMKNDVIIVCGSYGNNTKAYEYNGELKELGVSGKDIHYMGEGIFSVRESENSKKKLIDINGNLIKLNNYESVNDFSEGLARVEVDGKHGFIDKEGNEVVSPKFDYVRDFIEGLALVEADGKFSCIDKKGKDVISPKYEVIGIFNKSAKMVIAGMLKRGVSMSRSASEISEYEEAFSEQLIIVSEGDKRGVINLDGKVIIPSIYRYIAIIRR